MCKTDAGLLTTAIMVWFGKLALLARTICSSSDHPPYLFAIIPEFMFVETIFHGRTALDLERIWLLVVLSNRNCYFGPRLCRILCWLSLWLTFSHPLNPCSLWFCFTTASSCFRLALTMFALSVLIVKPLRVPVDPTCPMPFANRRKPASAMLEWFILPPGAIFRVWKPRFKIAFESQAQSSSLKSWETWLMTWVQPAPKKLDTPKLLVCFGIPRCFCVKLLPIAQKAIFWIILRV